MHSPLMADIANASSVGALCVFFDSALIELQECNLELTIDNGLCEESRQQIMNINQICNEMLFISKKIKEVANASTSNME